MRCALGNLDGRWKRVGIDISASDNISYDSCRGVRRFVTRSAFPAQLYEVLSAKCTAAENSSRLGCHYVESTCDDVPHCLPMFMP